MDREKQVKTIAIFRKSVTLTVACFFIILGVGTAMRSLLSAVLMPSTYVYIYQFVFSGMLVCLCVLYIYLLVLMYKMAKMLHNAQLLKVKPWLLLVLAIMATPFAFFINVIIVIVLWRKGNKLLSSPVKMS